MISRRKSSLRLSGMSIFSSIDRISRSSGSSSSAGVPVAHLLALRVRLHVVDVVGAEALEGVLVGRDGPLHFVLDDVLVFLADDGEQPL